MRNRLAVLVAVGILSTPPAEAKPAQDTGWIEGSWKGSGTSFGKPGTATLDIGPVLNGKFLELRYRVAIGERRPTIFEGRAFYRVSGPGRMEAQWFDNRGMTFPISASLSDTRLTANWGTTATEIGRTTYELRPNGQLEVTDTAKGKDGNWHQFARYVYDRKPNSGAEAAVRTN